MAPVATVAVAAVRTAVSAKNRGARGSPASARVENDCTTSPTPIVRNASTAPTRFAVRPIATPPSATVATASTVPRLERATTAMAAIADAAVDQSASRAEVLSRGRNRTIATAAAAGRIGTARRSRGAVHMPRTIHDLRFHDLLLMCHRRAFFTTGSGSASPSGKRGVRISQRPWDWGVDGALAYSGGRPSYHSPVELAARLRTPKGGAASHLGSGFTQGGQICSINGPS